MNITDNVQAGDASTVNGSIHVGNGARVDSQTVNGAIRLGRNVQASGNIETVNGSVFVDQGGRIGGGIETVNGAIGLVPHRGGAEPGDRERRHHRGGGLACTRRHHCRAQPRLVPGTSKRKPRVVIGPDAIVDGPLEFRREVTLYVHKSARTGTVTGAQAVTFESETAPQD